MHVVTFKPHACDRHVSEVCPILLNVYILVAVLCTIEIYIVNVERKTGVKVVWSDLRPRSRRFTSAQVKEAYLVPDEASDLTLDR